jgi:hypothetical protein
MGNSMSRGGYGTRTRYNQGYNTGGGMLGTAPVAAPATRRPFFYMGFGGRGGRGGGMRTAAPARHQGYATGAAPVRRRRNRFGLHFGRNRAVY